MEKIIQFEKGRSYACRASAFTPIQYNKLFGGSDYLKDIQDMAEKNEEMQEGTVEFSIKNYEQFARLAYTFVYQGLSKTPALSEEQKEFRKKYPDPWTWLDSFGSFSIYEILPEIIDLWMGNEETQSKPKNQQPAPPEK